MLAAACLFLGVLAALAPGASAEVVHGKKGHFFGVTLHRGVKPTQLPGSVAAAHPSRNSSTAAQTSSSANLQYHNGPVMHSSAPYLIFWAPSSNPIPSAWQTLMTQYFTDTARDSGNASNVYGVGRQFTDGSGFADYRKTFNANTQVIPDTGAFPTPDSSCAGKGSSCVGDTQIQAEITRLIVANHLPTAGTAGASTLPDSAPIYFVVLPSNMDVCYTDSTGTSCASSAFCAYHSAYTTGGDNVLYSAMPTLPVQSNPKACQDDGYSAVQQPNGNLADVAVKYLSHEDAETVTDPLGTGWWNSATGNENGDNCNGYTTNTYSFYPTLGGSTSGTLYSQVFNTRHYYVQSEWSNGDGNCEMQPTVGTLTAQFSPSPSAAVPGSSFSFNPGGSTSSRGYTSSTWDFGDGSTSFARSGPATVSHNYAGSGHYTATLTLVDNRGNLNSTSHQILIYSNPTAAFTSSPTQPLENTSVSFDGSGSSDPDAGVTITGYSWNWGDGTAAGSGATATHSYATPGTYTAQLTVTNSVGLTNTTSHQVTVLDEAPTAAFTMTPASVTPNQSVAFNATTSSDADGTIASSGYSWNFGDGSAAVTGATRSHAYTHTGVYSVTLTITDSAGQTASVSHQVTVGPIAAFTVTTQQPYQGASVTFDATGSSALPGTSIQSYDWDFGDGSTPHATTATATHVYTTPGTYTATLTVTNDLNQTDHVSKTITVKTDTPTAAFAVTTSPAFAGYPVSFDGSSSTDPAGSTLTYAWSYKDHANTVVGSGTGPTPTFTFTIADTYTVTLTVTNSVGHTDQTSKSLTVNTDVPVAAFTRPAALYSGYPASFDGTGSTDPAGAQLTYDWNWGDGSAHGIGPTASHTYTSTGNYTVTLTVTNTQTHSNALPKTVTVNVDTPVASFAPPVAYVGQPAGFDGSGSTDPAGSHLTYDWTWGDGSAAGTGATPTHTYASTGYYTVTLLVTNSQGRTSSTSKQVTVSPSPPTATFSVTTYPALAGQTVGFDGTGSTAATGTIVSYAWSFGASGATASNTFAGPGTYPVSLTVTDSHGQSSKTTQYVTVHAPPSAAFSFSPSSPVDHAPVTFNGGGSFNPDSTTTMTSYLWIFGDGSSGAGPTVSHSYSQPGNYVVELTVTNDLGLSNTTTQQVTVADEGPSAGFAITTARPASGNPVAFSGVSSNDPDGQIVSYRWRFGDGATGTGSAPVHTYAKPGQYTVSLSVTDSSGQTATTSKSVTVALSGRITKVTVKTSRTGATVLVSVNSPGTLTAGRKVFRVRSAGTVKVPINLTPAQLRTVARTHRLKISLPLRFRPSAGPVAAKTASVTFHTPRLIGGRLGATLGR